MNHFYVNSRFLSQPISGVQRYGIECSLQIKKNCPNVVFVAPKNILHTSIGKELGVITIGSSEGHLWEQFELPMYLKGKGNPPLLNLCNTAPIVYRNNYLTIHDLAFYHHPEWNAYFFAKWYNYLIPKIAHHAQHVFTVSETIKAELVQYLGLSPQKVSVTYNGISDNWIQNHATHRNKENIILSVGTFSKRKNQHKLVQAFIESGLGKTYTLLLIGEKNKIFKDSEINEKKAEIHNIKIIHEADNNQLKAWYEKAAIVVSLSLYEGFGIPLLEGLFFNCKLLCSNIPVYQEIYNGVATFCNPDDISEISAQLQQITLQEKPETDANIFRKYSFLASAKHILDVITKKEQLDNHTNG